MVLEPTAIIFNRDKFAFGQDSPGDTMDLKNWVSHAQLTLQILYRFYRFRDSSRMYA